MPGFGFNFMIFFLGRPGSKKGKINFEMIEECEFHTVRKVCLYLLFFVICGCCLLLFLSEFEEIPVW